MQAKQFFTELKHKQPKPSDNMYRS